ncbi:MAG: hypothetical protein AAB927_01580 [Patescibacteria group bacterium]
MGTLETQSRKRSRKNELRKIILTTIATMGVIGVGLVAPNVVGAMVKLGIIPSSRQKDVVNRSCERLIHSGLLARQGKFLRLTRRGELVLRSLEARSYRIPHPQKWDSKWRVLIFDIPERRKGLREKVRRTLNAIGFVRLQDSVWVYPYDCEDLITFLKADFRVGKDILYMVVDMLENDVRLRKLFGLH